MIDFVAQLREKKRSQFEPIFPCARILLYEQKGSTSHMMLADALKASRKLLKRCLKAFEFKLSRKLENSCIFELSVLYQKSVPDKEIRSENKITPMTP